MNQENNLFPPANQEPFLDINANAEENSEESSDENPFLLPIRSQELPMGPPDEDDFINRRQRAEAKYDQALNNNRHLSLSRDFNNLDYRERDYLGIGRLDRLPELIGMEQELRFFIHFFDNAARHEGARFYEHWKRFLHPYPPPRRPTEQDLISEELLQLLFVRRLHHRAELEGTQFFRFWMNVLYPYPYYMD